MADTTVRVELTDKDGKMFHQSLILTEGRDRRIETLEYEGHHFAFSHLEISIGRVTIHFREVSPPNHLDDVYS